jgi:Holliday junction resolvasome RuvABC DNA-binding subunit
VGAVRRKNSEIARKFVPSASNPSTCIGVAVVPLCGVMTVLLVGVIHEEARHVPPPSVHPPCHCEIPPVDGTRSAMQRVVTNARIANVFGQIATLLEQQGASAHRVRAWREGAQAIRDNPRELTDVFRDHGRVGLEAVPGIGPRLANVVIELIKSGHSAALDRLRGDGSKILERLPGLGPALAARVHDELGIETLEELEAAAHDGRLARVPGFGPRRIAGLRDVLATRLARARPTSAPRIQPSVALLLATDHAYRAAAAAGTLRRIAPRRFNPRGDAWLPIMHAEREGWTLTALFSNTARAHELGRTGDWVIIYFHGADHADGQATVVTEWRGPLRGQRVIRGREHECRELYELRVPADDAPSVGSL